MRTGNDYLASLADDRGVYLDGARVDDLARHPAFAGVVQTIASLFDLSADPGSKMRILDQDDRSANVTFLAPRSPQELAARRQAVDAWAGLTRGLITASPDYGASFVAGFASAAVLFDRDGNGGGERVRAFHRRMVDEDLYVTCALIPPQVGHGAPEDYQDVFKQVGVVREQDGGIVVRGAQMLATAGAMADYLLVSSLKPLQSGEERYALSFVVPLGAPGLKLSCRASYASGISGEFDYPLTARYDESDALVTFHDVFVPWEHVFVYRDVDLVEWQWRQTAAYALGNHQAQARLVVQTRFLLGLASMVVETKGLQGNPVVQERLGELAALVTSGEALVAAAEFHSEGDEFGVFRPATRFIDAALALQTDTHPRIVRLLRELMGATVLQTPATFRDLLSPETRDMIQGFVGSPSEPRVGRVKLFKLAWDAVGSEFASRHQQYELTYVGSPSVRRVAMHRQFDYREARESVTSFMSQYGLPDDGEAGSVSGRPGNGLV